MGLNQHLDTLLGDAARNGDLPGVVARIMRRDGTLLYEGAFGSRALGSAGPMTPDTVVYLASMTKPITTAAVLQLVEQGKLTLDDPASQWLPLLGEVQVLEGFDASGKPRRRAPKTAVTLRDLLRHTSGYTYEFFDADLLRYQQETGLPSVVTSRNAALQAPLRFDPGERWAYGTGIDFAGRIVEEVSGQRLRDYFCEHLFKPLAMHSTAFILTPDMHRRLAKVHARGPDGSLTATGFACNQEPEFDMGGGGLYGTAPDYIRFLRMVMNDGTLDGRRVLRAASVAEMTRNQLGALRTTRMKSAMPQLSHDFENFPSVPKGFGLGFQINLEALPTGRSANSLAWDGLANTHFWVDPKHDLCAVFCAQILPFADPALMAVYEKFETAVYAELG